MLSWILLVVIIISCIIPLIGVLLTSSPALAISLIVFGFIGAGLLLLRIIQLAYAPDIFIAIGIWLCFFGMVVAAIGGIAAITGPQHFHPQIPVKETLVLFRACFLSAMPGEDGLLYLIRYFAAGDTHGILPNGRSR